MGLLRAHAARLEDRPVLALIFSNGEYLKESSVDLKQHLLRQMAWSHANFGPGERTQGVIDHIKKELVEIEQADGAADEWVDVVILALDGLTRRLAFVGGGSRADPDHVAQTVCNMIVGKQTRNEGREWPDWRTAPKDKAIEHVKIRSNTMHPTLDAMDRGALAKLRG
jgi:hypothetical protein